MARLNQVSSTHGILLLGILSTIAAAQLPNPNTRTLQNTSTLQSKQQQLIVPILDSSTSLINNTHFLTRRGILPPPHGPDANSGLTNGHRHASLDKHDENPVDKIGYDTAAKAEYWEGKYDRWDAKKPFASSSKGAPRSARPSVSKGEKGFEAYREMWESGKGGGNNDRVPPKAPEAEVSRHKLDDGSEISGAELGELLGEPKQAGVGKLRSKYEGLGSESKPPLDGNRPDVQAQPANPARSGNQARPADMPRPGTVQDLKNKYENPPSSGSKPISKPAVNPRPASDPNLNPALDPIAEDPSVAEQLRQFSSFDSSGKPTTPPISPKSGAPSPPKKGLHEKINLWEKLSDKAAKKSPEATFELEDPALHPRPPQPPIPQDAGLDIEAAIWKGTEAVRGRNLDVQRLDGEIERLIGDMKRNAEYVKSGEKQIKMIRDARVKRDAAEKDMLRKKKELEAKRKRLADERKKLENDKSGRQQDLAREAMDELVNSFKTFNEGLDRMFSTIDEMGEWRKSSERLLEAAKNNMREGHALSEAILADRARRAAERAARQTLRGNGAGKGTPESPPIVQSAQVENGQIASLKTKVPPPNMPLPIPASGGMIAADNPMRIALDDIRIKGKLTQETADRLVESGWGIAPAAEKVLKDNGLPVDNMAKAKGAIAGFAATAHMAPVGVMAAAPEALELAALAGSPEILAAVGVSMAAPEIANVASGAFPVINGAAGTVGTIPEQALQQGVVAAQVVGVAGKESFTLITTGTTVVTKSSVALIAAGAGTLGAGLGLIGGFIGGLFARKHAKEDAKTHTVHMTVEKIHSKTVVEYVTETFQEKTITAGNTKFPKSTHTEASTMSTYSERSSKSSQSKTTSSSSSASKISSSSSSMSTQATRTTKVPSKSVVQQSKETGKALIGFPPVIAPVATAPSKVNFTNSTGSTGSVTAPYPLVNVTKSDGNLRISTPPIVLPPYPITNVTTPVRTMSNGTLPIILPSTKATVTSPSQNFTASTSVVTAPSPWTNVTNSVGNIDKANWTNPVSTRLNGFLLSPYPFTNVTGSVDNLSNESLPLILPPTKVNGTIQASSGSNSSLVAPYPFANVTKPVGDMSNSPRPMALPQGPYRDTNVTAGIWNITVLGLVSTTTSELVSKMTPSAKNWNISTPAPTLVLTLTQVANITSGALHWQNATGISSPMSQLQNLTLTSSLALPSTTGTQPWSNTSQSIVPTTFQTLVKPMTSITTTWLNTTSTAFPNVPVTLTSTPTTVMAGETAVAELEDDETPETNSGFNLKTGWNSTVSRAWRFARRS